MVLVEIEALYHYKGMDKKLLSSGPLSRIQLRLVSYPPAFFVTRVLPIHAASGSCKSLRCLVSLFLTYFLGATP